MSHKGKFTTLQNISYLRHGFSDGYPAIGFQSGVNTPETIQTHKSFLRDYGMEPYEKIIMIRSDGTPYIFLDTVFEKDPEVPFYGSVRAECVITSLKDYSLNIKLADCAGFLGTVIAKDGTELLLLLHGSRNSLASNFWVQAINAARERYAFNPSEIYGGVTPHMCVQCHTLRNLDQLPHAEQWKKERIVSQDVQGLWHFDSTTLLKQQLEEAGVLLKNIAIDTRCTYEVYTKAIEENKQPPLYSHRSYTDHYNDPRFYPPSSDSAGLRRDSVLLHNGRFVLSGMLK